MEAACRRPASKSLSSRSGRPRHDASCLGRFVAFARRRWAFPHRQVNAPAAHASRIARRAPRTRFRGLSLLRTEITVTGIPWRAQCSRPTASAQLPPSIDPVRSTLHRSPFAIGAAASTSKTRCQQSARKPQWLDFSATPPWDESLASPSLRIKVLVEACHPMVIQSGRPISLRSPFIPRFRGSFQDHRSGSAPSGLDCSSSNLLEPSAVCDESPEESKEIGAGRASVNRIYFLLYQPVTGLCLWIAC